MSPLIPAIGTVEDLVAEVAQHLSGPSFSQPNVDCPRIQHRLTGRQTRHRRQEGHANPPRLLRHRHALRISLLGEPKRAAVERLLVGVVELQTARPVLSLRNPLYNDVNPYVLSPLLPPHLAHVPDMQIPPQQIRVRHWHGNQVTPVDRHPRSLLWGRLPFSSLVPSAKADAPQSQRLQSSGFARVVRTNEDHRVPQLDRDLFKALEVADG